ncbi:MAG: adenine phosphoribosyltransferase [Clostridia bacterium]|nr:adenine phosphoribosyltransferase [Clostridia bacterium]
MSKYFRINVAGLERDLLVCPLNDKLSIAAFILFGDVELTEKCAAALLERAPEHDIIITAESKGIPLAYEMAKQEGNNSYIVARKGIKVYMPNPVSVEVQSITTKGKQTLHLGEEEIKQLRGKKVLIVDDVISTGESLRALEELVLKVGGTIAGKMAVLAEGDAANRDDIIVLGPLPLLDSEGNPVA